jgi:hypothetical protein
VSQFPRDFIDFKQFHSTKAQAINDEEEDAEEFPLAQTAQIQPPQQDTLMKEATQMLDHQRTTNPTALQSMLKNPAQYDANPQLTLLNERNDDQLEQDCPRFNEFFNNSPKAIAEQNLGDEEPKDSASEQPALLQQECEDEAKNYVTGNLNDHPGPVDHKSIEDEENKVEQSLIAPMNEHQPVERQESPPSFGHGIEMGEGCD